MSTPRRKPSVFDNCSQLVVYLFAFYGACKCFRL
nr:MAG TPA: hypothetical protein [Caudoviricetes sp.]